MAVEEQEGPRIPEWVVTFGDMMSLLLTFFIMLLSMSEMKQEDRYQAMVESMRKRFGHHASSKSVMPGRLKPRNSRLAKLATMGRAQRFDTHRGGAKFQSPTGEFQPPDGIARGQVATSLVNLYFPDDSAEITPVHEQRLAVAKDMFAGYPQKIAIRAHTSRKPLAEGSHWDLSYRRGVNVMNYLVDRLKMDSRRMVITLAGPNELVHDGTDALKSAQNSRVEVYMLNKTVADFTGERDDKKEGKEAPFKLPK